MQQKIPKALKVYQKAEFNYVPVKDFGGYTYEMWRVQLLQIL